MSYLRTLWYFFDFPNRRCSLNELAKELDMAKTTVSKVVDVLADEGFLAKEAVGNAFAISAVFDHPFTLTRKVPYHLQLLYDEEVVRGLVDKYPEASSITVYGSYRKGSDTDHSDLDIAVELPEGSENRIDELIVPRLGFRRDIPMNILCYTRSRIDANVFADIANGIVLNGFIDVKP
jgi:DNA-binding Lrp family transcriptional regulator